MAASKAAHRRSRSRSRQMSAVRSSGKPKVSCSLKAVSPLKTVVAGLLHRGQLAFEDGHAVLDGGEEALFFLLAARP
jgi:hypothetical protein